MSWRALAPLLLLATALIGGLPGEARAGSGDPLRHTYSLSGTGGPWAEGATILPLLGFTSGFDFVVEDALVPLDDYGQRIMGPRITLSPRFAVGFQYVDLAVGLPIPVWHLRRDQGTEPSEHARVIDDPSAYSQFSGPSQIDVQLRAGGCFADRKVCLAARLPVSIPFAQGVAQTHTQAGLRLAPGISFSLNTLVGFRLDAGALLQQVPDIGAGAFRPGWFVQISPIDIHMGEKFTLSLPAGLGLIIAGATGRRHLWGDTPAAALVLLGILTSIERVEVLYGPNRTRMDLLGWRMRFSPNRHFDFELHAGFAAAWGVDTEGQFGGRGGFSMQWNFGNVQQIGYRSEPDGPRPPQPPRKRDRPTL